VTSGVQSKEDMSKEEVESLCLSLIKRGGPAFHVGTEMYKNYVQ